MIIEYKNVLYFATFVLSISQVLCNTILDEWPICSSKSTQNFRLNSGDVKTVSHSGEIDILGNLDNVTETFPNRCSVKITSCRSCHLVVSVVYLKMVTCSNDGSCRCDYLSIKEPFYEKSSKPFCGFLTNTSDIYESLTKIIEIEYISNNFKSAFSIQIKSYSNIYEIRGHSLNFKLNNTGFIESPYFPTKYRSDFSSEFILENASPNGLVQLTFTDFQLSPWSYIEIYDSNRTKLDKFNGNVVRPPIILSSGPYLSLKFVANEEYPNPGFRAQYLFIGYQDTLVLNTPITACGGVIRDYGGTITMSNIDLTDISQSYDCIWIIHPTITQETHLSLKVVQFENFAARTSLRIREGLYSKSYLLETLSSGQGVTQSIEYTAQVTTGFYLRLKGTFTNQSKLAIVFTAFQLGGCLPNKDFRCDNGRCIEPMLHCDGYNHCGDGSDEVACLDIPATNSPDNGYWWHTFSPNYYFPKQENTSSAGTNTLIIVTSLAGLGMFILTTGLILVKLHKQRRHDAINREVLSTISAEIDSSPNRIPFSATIEPPLYDPPPSYEDVIKYYLPPPPTYTSVISPSITDPNLLRNYITGVENAAFVPDNPIDSRQGLASNILTVILPEGNVQASNQILSINPCTNNESSLIEKQSNVKHSQPQVVNLEPLVLKVNCENSKLSVESTFSSIDACSKCSCKGACSCPVSLETNDLQGVKNTPNLPKQI